MKVATSRQDIFISQRKYTLDFLKKTGNHRSKPTGTPLEKGWNGNTTRSESPVDKRRYQRLVGKLIYLSLTRPDIVYVVSVLSQFMHCPTKKHPDAVTHILRYLRGTPGKGLLFKKNEERGITWFANADQAGSIKDYRSTSEYYTKLQGNLVTWRSKKQSVVACSGAEVEYRAIA